ncbi:uracil-DNA glycosylase family protein [Geomonas sp.]|uniref:uracil-DNA glycosylase family protein n=1 Tax=Geomonas sp. TaxID=2651584 RepID=UPI002B463061|nr:uracil-DNA glycosylase family protein [Geomonas sp.]HJV35318.1 uracil-DNA glycosylase family protein [Geomonas sp.]
MVELQEREELLASLKGYLEELKESGVEELPVGTGPLPAAAVSPVAAGAAPLGAAAPAAAPSAAPAAVVSPADSPAPSTAATASLPHEAPAPSPVATIQTFGNPSARLFFVIAGGGFEGASGALLAKIVAAMGFAPEQVLLASLDRDISPSDAALRKAVTSKIAEVAPEAVVALGEKAAQLILESAAPISRLRGRLVKVGGVSVMATLHPFELLADEALKREVWNEMKKVMAHLTRTVTPS